MKKLKDIIANIDIKEITGRKDISVRSIHFDSRQVEKQSLFVAIKGTQVDGHQYINHAVEKGAKVIVAERIPEKSLPDITYIKTTESSKALGFIASAFYNNPSENIKLIGVTGTNGKSSVVIILYNLFKSLGYKTGLMSTIENKIDTKTIAPTHTTSDTLYINKLLSKMGKAKCTHCFIEVSSHAIDQNRIAGLKFTGGIFTNITHDHLDYHLTFKDYIGSKKMFFDLLPKDAFALSNYDDKNGEFILQNTKANKKSYSLYHKSNFKGKIIENQINGLLLDIDGTEVWFKLIGKFNAYNILAAYSAARLLGLEKENILTHLSEQNGVEGRFEIITEPGTITGIVDYAHTPDALKNVLETIITIKTKDEKLISVAGAGGDRDKKKRPLMGKIAAALSDKVIFTSDNPRSEDPSAIIEEMKQDLTNDELKNILEITDRKEAIKTACMLAENNDIIIVTGKGHEKYQEIKGEKISFDDKKVLKGFISKQLKQS